MDNIYNAATFLQDLIISVPDLGCKKEFKARFYNSKVVKCLEDIVLSKNIAARRHAVYVLGKTCPKESLPILREAFLKFKENDPFLLSTLVFGIYWLSDYEEKIIKKLLIELSECKSVLSRWSLLDFPWSYGDDIELWFFENIAPKLCLDQFKPIAQESRLYINEYNEEQNIKLQ